MGRKARTGRGMKLYRAKIALAITVFHKEKARKASEMSEKRFYRYESIRCSAVIDPEREIYGISRPQLVLYEYRMHSETPKGYWIGYLAFGGKDRWISKTSRKRFAHETKEAALEAYIKRKEAYVRHCKERLNRAQEDLALAK